MFFGEYQVSFQKEKNRLALPAKVRNQIKGEEVVLAQGFDGCIFGYEKGEWQKFTNRELAGSVTEKKSRQIRRHLFSGAAVVSYDSQGRTVIPQNLVNYANLIDSLATIIGAGDHFEIWNNQEWKKYLETNKQEVW
ncbi:MAG: division/cell wall cluster transcriptional repressor MraZ [Candidatus Shapirobacteria bacterium]|nr:division/cell wall cluster transcriptional repressor MraZ [Candidatus Shapirobacteria bacterium]